LTHSYTFGFQPSYFNTLEVLSLASGYLLGDTIAHGAILEKNSVLQYLCYLHKIGVIVTPLSDNASAVSYKDQTFSKLFYRGLKVSLGTDSPLEIHSTADALAEEYAVAAQMWRLTPCDLSEIARNSILNSTFSSAKKTQILGKDYELDGPQGNDACKTNVPSIRLAFRQETHAAEEEFLSHIKINEQAQGDDDDLIPGTEEEALGLV